MRCIESILIFIGICALTAVVSVVILTANSNRALPTASCPPGKTEDRSVGTLAATVTDSNKTPLLPNDNEPEIEEEFYARYNDSEEVVFVTKRFYEFEHINLTPPYVSGHTLWTVQFCLKKGKLKKHDIIMVPWQCYIEGSTEELFECMTNMSHGFSHGEFVMLKSADLLLVPSPENNGTYIYKLKEEYRPIALSVYMKYFLREFEKVLKQTSEPRLSK